MKSSSNRYEFIFHLFLFDNALYRERKVQIEGGVRLLCVPHSQSYSLHLCCNHFVHSSGMVDVLFDEDDQCWTFYSSSCMFLSLYHVLHAIYGYPIGFEHTLQCCRFLIINMRSILSSIIGNQFYFVVRSKRFNCICGFLPYHLADHLSAFSSSRVLRYCLWQSV